MLEMIIEQPGVPVIAISPLVFDLSRDISIQVAVGKRARYLRYALCAIRFWARRRSALSEIVVQFLFFFAVA
jgi:hypothetical protein